MLFLTDMLHTQDRRELTKTQAMIGTAYYILLLLFLGNMYMPNMQMVYYCTFAKMCIIQNKAHHMEYDIP